MRLRDLQREIEEGLNVVESSNRANDVIAHGNHGTIASNRRDEQEMFVACLRILQAALVYVNTLMLQDVLDEPDWLELLTPRRPAWADPPVLDSRAALRRSPPRHDRPSSAWQPHHRPTGSVKPSLTVIPACGRRHVP